MPVSLSEWRVRIGTFVHWIREYEVKERRERLLKERIRRLKVLCERLEAKRGDSGEDDKRRQDGPDPKGCPHKTANIRSSGNSSDIKDLLTSCDQCIQDLLTASDSHIKEILTPSATSIKELITPNDCSIRSLNSLNGPTIKDIITPNDSGIKELISTNDSRIKNLVKANDDSRIQDLVKSNDDSRIQDLLTTNYSSTCISDPITPRYCSIKDSTSLNASSIKDLITPNDSSIINLITSEYSKVKELITFNDSKIDSLLSPNKTNIKRLIQPDNDYIEEQLARTCTSDDESIEHDTQVGDSEEQHMSDFSISPSHSLSDASVMELLTSSNSSTKDLRTPTDDLNAYLIIKTSNIKDHETQSDGSVKELPSPGSGTTVCQTFAPCDDLLVELLKPTVYASKDLPSIDLCCHEPDRQNEPFSEESRKRPHFVGKEQHPQPYTFTKEATDDEVLKEHHISSGSCKKSQTETSILMAVERSPVVVPFISRKYRISDRYEEKQMEESASSCHGPSLNSKTDLISGQIPPLSELLLLKSGDVELNPGPREE
ncbi:uncharacterized protein LOC115924703 [Strongylocentrotus purpuratus]|uniref:Uncharacterized protein n=1 Tax=Strongylocentrotus purpuratus TaxID=7668 RepID=A0A7M7SZT0_STRPU|nr:uncharacterized protein LOC115924703 [Strongylocentrotus purpuratus]